MNYFHEDSPVTTTKGTTTMTQDTRILKDAVVSIQYEDGWKELRKIDQTERTLLVRIPMFGMENKIECTAVLRLTNSVVPAAGRLTVEEWYDKAIKEGYETVRLLNLSIDDQLDLVSTYKDVIYLIDNPCENAKSMHNTLWGK